MADLKDVVNKVLLPLQLSLGIFQIIKTTPLWAVIHCALASFLNYFHFPYTDYKHLTGFECRVFKKVISHAATAGTKVIKKQKDPEKSTKEGESQDAHDSVTEEMEKNPEKPKKEAKSGDPNRASVKYLGKSFELERKDGNIMVMSKDGPAYYITDKMWETVKYIEKVASKAVFVKDHKELWEEVVTGDIMEFEEVLDSVILDNRTIIRLDNDYFLPVNLVKSEVKLTTTLNFVGLFLKTQKHVHWLVPALLTFVAAIMGFRTNLRFHIGRLINTILCRSLQIMFDLLPSAKRRRAYSSMNWVENLKPSNDLKSKTVRCSTVVALVAGGAKLDSYESFADLESLDGKNNMHVILDVHSESLTFGDLNHISVLVCGGVKAHHEDSTGCEPWDHLVIMAGKSNNIRTFLTGGTKGQPDRSDFHQFAHHWDERVHEIWPVVGPFLFQCESVYIEWIYDNKTKVCSLKTGRTVASRESLIAHDVSMIICDDNGEDNSGRNDAMPLGFPFPCGKGYNDSLIADDFDTTSIEVDCESEEAIKLLKFAFYMAKHKTTSLKSYDRKTRKGTFRRFVESVHAYDSSRYPPLERLIVEDVVSF